MIAKAKKIAYGHLDGLRCLKRKQTILLNCT